MIISKQCDLAIETKIPGWRLVAQIVPYSTPTDHVMAIRADRAKTLIG